MLNSKCSDVMQISVFQMRFPLFSVNYLVENVKEMGTKGLCGINLSSNTISKMFCSFMLVILQKGVIFYSQAAPTGYNLLIYVFGLLQFKTIQVLHFILTRY